MIFIDANVLMYAAGATHPHKAPSLALLARIARGEVDGATNAEVLQEILHRYRSIGRWEEGRRVYDLTREIIVAVMPLTVETVDEARSLMDGHSELSARDAVHAAFCRVTGAQAICSYDRDFDRVPGLRRLEPQEVQ